MLYEEKLKLVGVAVAESINFSTKNNPPTIYTKNNDYINKIPLNEIRSILDKFVDEKKLEIVTETHSSFLPDFTEPKDVFSFKILDKEYFIKFLPKKHLDIENSPMRKLRKSIEYVTGLTTEESAKLRLVDVQNNEKQVQINGNRHFYIEYNSDRRILFNGKILMGKPQFGRDSELIFEYLFNNPYVTFTRKDIEEKLKIKINDRFQKITDRLGFKAGFRDAFFDIHEDTIHPDNSTIQFKNDITL